MTALGLAYCLDCECPRELKPNGNCSTCDSTSVMKLPSLESMIENKSNQNEVEGIKEDVMDALNYNIDSEDK